MAGSVRRMFLLRGYSACKITLFGCEYEPKNANVVTYQCYQFKTVEKGIKGEIGAGRWHGYWYFNQEMPAKIYPLHLKVEKDLRYHS